jgi:hypothetical protein
VRFADTAEVPNEIALVHSNAVVLNDDSIGVGLDENILQASAVRVIYELFE